MAAKLEPKSFKHTHIDKPDCSGPAMDISNKASGEIKIAYTYSISFEVSLFFNVQYNSDIDFKHVELNLIKNTNDQVYQVHKLLMSCFLKQPVNAPNNIIIPKTKS